MIPAQAVEAAAKLICGAASLSRWEEHGPLTQEAYRAHAREALEAAAPYMHSAWEAERNLEDKADEARREWLDDKEDEL